MTVDFAKEYLLDDCEDCPENENGECMTKSHCFEVKRMAIQALEQTKWIPVSERLPKAFQPILVTSEAFHWANEPVTYSVKQTNFGGIVDFIAWMPLPQPYNAESEDKCKNCKYYRNPDYTRCHECEAEREDKE